MDKRQRWQALVRSDSDYFIALQNFTVAACLKITTENKDIMFNSMNPWSIALHIDTKGDNDMDETAETREDEEENHTK